MTNEEIKKVEGLMRSIKDFPAPGIIFRDITTILKDKEGLQIIICYGSRRQRIYLWSGYCI